jgi:hypothetical protein
VVFFTSTWAADFFVKNHPELPLSVAPPFVPQPLKA